MKLSPTRRNRAGRDGIELKELDPVEADQSWPNASRSITRVSTPVSE
jgi:hypothetical protein